MPERFGGRGGNGIIDPPNLGLSRAVVDDGRTHVVTANFITRNPALLLPLTFSLGNGSRRYPEVRGPKVKRLDLLLSRLQKVRNATLELRVEAQNAFNTPQMHEPIGDFNSVDYGKIEQRRLQPGVRLAF